MRRRKTRFAAIGALALLAATVALGTRADAQSVLRVPQNYPTIAQALAVATTGTTVLVEPGRYAENLTWPSVDGIRLVSLGGASATILDGTLAGRVITVGAGLTRATVIAGFTIERGLAADGAGLHLSSPITVRENIVTKCEGRSVNLSRGAGIFVAVGVSPRIERNVITANVQVGARTNQGAGLWVGASSRAEIVANGIVANASQGPDRSFGGGAYFEPSGIPSPLFASNVVARNTVQGASVAQGGGLFVAGGTVRVTGNTVADNACVSATRATGGGMYFGGLNGASPVRNNIVVKNTLTASTRVGGGVHCDNANIRFDYNDAWQNTPDDFFGCVPGVNNVSVDPRFGGANDYHLAATSPLLDAGDDAAVFGPIAVDVDGDPRQVDGDLDGNAGNGARVDIGADEVTASRLQGATDLGRGIDFSVAGPAGSSYAVAVSAAPGTALVAPFGTFLLAPPFAVVAAGTAPGTNLVPVPYAPSLEGLRVFAQALVYRNIGPQTLGQFTNRLALTLSSRFGRPIVEQFTSAAQYAAGNAAWSPGKPGLFATFGFGGSGRDGDLDVTGNVTLDGDRQSAGPLAEWNFRNLTVRPGATLTLTGRRPVRLNVLGTCVVDGTIVASGKNGRNGPAGKASAVGILRGGRGGPGAGDGGSANVNPTGPIGSLPEDLRGFPGYPKANRCNDFNKSDNRLITVVEPNCGGGTGGNRGVPSGITLRNGCSGNGGGHGGDGDQTDFLCGNINAFGREFGVRWIVPTGTGAVQQPTAGTGGGAGGNAAIVLANPRPIDDIVAGSGGGGGGGLEIVALGALTVRGSILADGGNGGTGYSTVVGSATVQAGYGAGGSGGAIWLSGTAVTVDATATLSAQGGVGNPSPPNPPRSGDGGDGYIVVRDLSGTPNIVAGASITPPQIAGRGQYASASGKSTATSKWYTARLRNPVWAFDANNPQTGVVIPGNDLTFLTAPTTGQQVKIAFQGAPDVNGKPDPNPANWVPQNGFTFNILQLAGKNLRHIRYKIDFDLGPVSGLPLPSQIAIGRVTLRY